MSIRITADMRNMANGYTMSYYNWNQYWNAMILIWSGDFSSPRMRELDISFNMKRMHICEGIVFW